MQGSSKIEPRFPIELTTGGNISIDTGAFVQPSLPSDTYTKYLLFGTKTLTSDLDVVASGTLYVGVKVNILYVGALTLSGNNFTMFGVTVPAELAAKRFLAECSYNGSSWDVVIYPDFSQSGIVGEDRLAADSVVTAKIKDANVTLAKLEGVTSGNIIVGNASNRPASVAMSGDATISNTGAISIGNGKVTNAMIASGVDASKMTAGTLPNDRLSAVPSTKLADLGKLYSKYSDTSTTAVTTEETLGAYTVAGGTVSADGQGLRIVVGGTTAGNANTKTIRVKIGSNTYLTNAVTTAPNGKDWYATLEVIRSGATSSVGFGNLVVGAVPEGVGTSKAGITWTNDIVVSVTGQNGTASANDFVLSMMVIELLK